MPRTSKNSTKSQTPSELTPGMETPDSLASLIDVALEKHFARAENSNKEHFARMEQRFDSLQSELSSLKVETRALRSDHSALLKRTKTLERTTASLSDTVSVTQLKLADLEDRSRRNNICFHGLPEGAEGPNTQQYLMKQLCQWCPSLADPPLKIMRAHRIGPPRRGTKPRVLIMQCLRYTDRDRILKAMRDSPMEVSSEVVPLLSGFQRTDQRETQSLLSSHGASPASRFPSVLVVSSIDQAQKGPRAECL